MKYVALLRGINVGGNNKVSMKDLKDIFESAGLEQVRTYINSGNIIFSDDKRSIPDLVEVLETAIKKKLGFALKVLICSQSTIQAINKALPDNWVNDEVMKCDVMFLWETVDTEDVLLQLKIVPHLDDVKYVKGAIIWRVDRKDVTRSGLLKLVGTDLYKQMTIRNCNTTRKLLELMTA